MKQKFENIEQANLFIDNANILLGLPNEKNGTLTYSIPEPIISKDENDEDVIVGYEVPVTEELDKLLNPKKYETIIEENINTTI